MYPDLISVIIPTYNSGKFLEATLDSVLNQTYINLELICVDNGSTDNTLEIINQYCKKDNRVTLIHEQTKGANFARNAGIKNSNGKYVQFLDSDDLIESTKLETQVYHLIQSGADVVVSDREIYNESMTLKLDTLTFESINKDPLITAITEIIITGNPLYLLSTVKEIGSWDESLSSAQDWDFHIKLALAKKKIIYVPGFFLHSRRHDNSLSYDWIGVNFNAAIVLDKYKDAIQKNFAFDNFEVRKKIFFVYFLAAIHSKSTKDYIEKIYDWGLANDAKKILSSFNRILLFLFGLKTTSKIQAIRSRLKKTKNKNTFIN